MATFTHKGRREEIPYCVFATRGGAAVVTNEVASSMAWPSGVGIVITMLPAGQHVRDVYTGPDGVLLAAAGDTLLIGSSTIDVETARAVAAAAEKKGLPMLDAPVSGGTGGAQAGTLTFMVGGSETQAWSQLADSE